MWQKFRIVFNEQASNFVEESPWLFLSFGVCVATCILVYLILVIGERCCTRKKYYRRSTSQLGKAYWRIVWATLAIIVLAGGFWIAAQMFGLQFFSILLTYGLVTLIATYTFGTALQCTGAFLFINTTGKVIEDDYILVVGSQVEGTVVFIGVLYTTIETPAGNMVDIPNVVLLSSMVETRRSAPVPPGGAGLPIAGFYRKAWNK